MKALTDTTQATGTQPNEDFEVSSKETVPFVAKPEGFVTPCVRKEYVPSPAIEQPIILAQMKNKGLRGETLRSPVETSARNCRIVKTRIGASSGLMLDPESMNILTM